MKLFSTTALLFAFQVTEAFARAGGGGGGGGGSGGGGYGHGRGSLVTIIMLPLILFYYWQFQKTRDEKNHAAESIIRSAATEDPAWNSDHLHDCIRNTFRMVQRGWHLRDQSVCRNYMSESLYLRHQKLLDKMIRKHRQDVIEEIDIQEVSILGAYDHPEDEKDAFWAYISCRMVDYQIDTRSGKIKRGNKIPYRFTELWTFRRQENGWVVDFIDPEPNLQKIAFLVNRRISSNAKPEADKS